MSDPIGEIFGVMSGRGRSRYGGESVSQLAHALQCAGLAENEGMPSNVITAALLHDYGHLVGDGDEGLSRLGIDARHEVRGSSRLAAWFGPEVTEPIRLHVAAKRYLCATDPGYRARLSPASVRSLEVQGGLYSPAEAEAFMRQPYAAMAVRLRRWDDLAKEPEKTVPSLDHFAVHVEICLG